MPVLQCQGPAAVRGGYDDLKLSDIGIVSYFIFAGVGGLWLVLGMLLYVVLTTELYVNVEAKAAIAIVIIAIMGYLFKPLVRAIWEIKDAGAEEREGMTV